jgi:hypothetical protein
MFKKISLVLLILALVLPLGCSGKSSLSPGPGTPRVVESPKATTLKVLLTDKEVYYAAFKTLALLDSQGKLPPAAKKQAISLGNKYMAAHNMAVQVLLDNGQPSLESVRAALDAFLVFAAPYTVEGK